MPLDTQTEKARDNAQAVLTKIAASENEAAILQKIEAERHAVNLEAWLRERSAASDRRVAAEAARFKDRVPKSIAIVAMGMSHQAYVLQAATLGGRKEIAEETWAINAMGGLIESDRIFQLDDVMLGEQAAVAHSCSAGIMKWMREPEGPIIYGPREHPDYPRMVEYPLEQVINGLQLPHPYMNNTVPYCVAYAMHIGVKAIHLFGCDYTYPNAHAAEAGHACLALLLQDALRRGIQVAIPPTSTLLDMFSPSARKFYGYRDEQYLHRVVERNAQGQDVAWWRIRPYPPEPPKPA